MPISRKILITRRLPSVAKRTLEEYFTVVSNPRNEALSPELLIKLIGEFDAVISTVSDRITAQVMEKAENLVAISNCAAGLDNIDVGFAERRGIAIYNTPDAVTDSTADMTFALILALARRVGAAQEYVRCGEWGEWDPEIFLGTELAGKTLGIVGYGRIGRAVAERAFGFGLRVIFYDPYVAQAYNIPIHASSVKVTFKELLKQSDIISIHAGLTNETRGMFGAAEVSVMERAPILVNVARGPIVITPVLVQALLDGQISAAALDVTDPEPLPAGHPLLELENCLVVPHIGTATEECRYKMAEDAALNIMRHFGG